MEKDITTQFVKEICSLLGISVPKITYDNSHFETDTMLAQCEPARNTIYLSRVEKPNPDYLFSVAHELRHLFQYQKNPLFYLSGYRTSDECMSIDEYNLQPAEVDANAFASIVMLYFFSIKPQWMGLSDRGISAINARTDYLLSNEFDLEA